MLGLFQLAAVATGGALGAVARFVVSNGVYRLLGREFPWGTLAVNVTGSLLMGALFVVFLERSTASAELRAAVLIGFLGAFTTFSTFSLETLALLEQGQLVRALLNVAGSVCLCLGACWAGMLAARAV